MRANWREPDVSLNRNSAVDEKDTDLLDRLGASEIPPHQELLSEENLYESELASVVAMKISAEQLKAAMRRRMEEADENVRPAKKARGRGRAELGWAPKAAADTPPVAAVVVSEGGGGDGRAKVIAGIPAVVAAVGPSRMASKEMPRAKAAPGQVKMAVEEGELQVPPVEAKEETPAAA